MHLLRKITYGEFSEFVQENKITYKLGSFNYQTKSNSGQFNLQKFKPFLYGNIFISAIALHLLLTNQKFRHSNSSVMRLF